MTLVEVLISMSIAMMTVGAIIYGYTSGTNRTEWSVYSLAAQSLALQGVEAVRAANWDESIFKDEVIPINFPKTNLLLDVPFKGTNKIWATNITTITTISANPSLKMIRVDCVWPFLDYSTGRIRDFTNTAVTYRSPNN